MELIMYETKNNLQIRTRTQIISLLQDRLADCIDLMNQGKQAHWNVKGPNFFSLHELFDKVSEETEEYVDLIAERIVQLGGIAEGTVQSVSKRSSMPAYPLEISKGSEHVERFSHSLAYFGELARNAINQANEINDADTADIFTEISRGVDKWLWMVEAHNQ
jgi:starvation-inducible DNA-binding protein